MRGHAVRMPVLWSATLFLAVLVVSVPAPGQSPTQVAAGSTFAPGGQELFLLDVTSTPVGTFPSGITRLSGTMDVVIHDGVPMLRATEFSEFLITLPSALPQNFTIEVDIVPKSEGPQPDLTLEGMARINQDVGSAHLLWMADASFGAVSVIGGSTTNHEFPIPDDLRVTLPFSLARVGVSVQGGTIAFFTNGRQLYTVPANFARGRVLRVTLGGVTEDSATVRPVYLARVRIATGAPVTVASAPPATTAGTAAPGAPAAVPAAAPTAIPAAAPTASATPIPSPTGTGIPSRATGAAPGAPVATQPAPRSAAPAPPPGPSTATAGVIHVGTGISDITGPIAEVGMLGYGNGKDHGLHMRLYARAFVFHSPATGRRVAFVSAELGMMYSAVKQGVLGRLNRPGGPAARLYDDRNVMLSATHTHAGPGGFSHHVMYNLTTMGHVSQNYDAIVDGITEAIEKASASLAPATVGWLEGLVSSRISVNRSKQAFDLNPEVLLGQNPVPDDHRMVVLSIRRNGQPAGAISWLALHNTSLTQANYLVSSDHKGYAAYLFEKQYGNIFPLQHTTEFIAAFPNGAEGDQSPNIMPGWVGPGRLVRNGQGQLVVDEFDSNRIVGELEFNTAHSLFQASQNPVIGDVDFRHTFLLMPRYVVKKTTHTNGMGLPMLCDAAYGVSFPAGAEDGPTDFRLSYILNEGIRLGTGPGEMPEPTLNLVKASLLATVGALLAPVSILVPPLIPVVTSIMGALTTALAMSSDPCQLPKPVLLPTGRLLWTAQTLPFQLLRIGGVVIAGIPGEMTVQAGRRLEADLLARLSPLGVQRVILTGLANEYSGYITTPEEYNSQQYEGASTLFGRLTFDAYMDVFGDLADALAGGRAPTLSSPPPLPQPPQLELQTGVLVDATPPGESFGQVLIQPMGSFQRGGLVHVEFRAGHPKNDLKRNGTYVRIERDDPAGGPPELVAWDAMPETKLFWRNDDIATSRMIVMWTIPTDAKSGTYRITHEGKYKDRNGVLHDYSGTSAPFVIP